MPTKDGFDPAEPLPRFLTKAFSSEVDTGSREENASKRKDRAPFRFNRNGNGSERAEQDIDSADDEAAPRSGIVRASILTAAATAIGIAVLAAGDPMALLAWVSASLVGNSSTATLQSAADQVLPPAVTSATTSREIAASELAGADRTENRELPSETLKHFQAWAAAREAQARSEPVQPVQDAPAQVEQAPAQAAQDAPAQDAPASAAEGVREPDRLVQKRRQVRSFRNARAEMRTRHLRKVRRAERARAEPPPAQDARAQDTSAQNAPPLPYWFGLGNLGN